jgi:quercetin dioxygenase-like cupin family protein
MDEHDLLHDAVVEYAFGTLEEPRRAELERRLAASPELRARLAQARELAADLAELVPSAAPSDGLWGRIAARVARGPGEPRDEDTSVQPWKSWSAGAGDEDGFRFEREARYERTATPGVEVRRLSLDAANDRVTIEVRMAPGASYPPHRHGGVEECYVLEGDLQVGSTEMRAGDFQRMETGSEHPVQSTRGGCRLLIVSSLHDELLP